MGLSCYLSNKAALRSEKEIPQPCKKESVYAPDSMMTLWVTANRLSIVDNKTHRLLCRPDRIVVHTSTELSWFLRLSSVRYHHYYYHHHHVAIIELCHFLTRSSLINPQDSSVVFPGSFCFLVCRIFIILGNLLGDITRLITLPYLLIRQRLYVLYCRSQWVVSVVRYSSRRRDDHSSRGVYQLRCIVVFHLETSSMRRPWPALGCSASGKEIYYSIAQGNMPCKLRNGK